LRCRKRIFAVIVLLSAPAPAMAEPALTFPISIPQECVELAHREGSPTVLKSRYEALKARAKLARLSARDPLVQQCRGAVERARAALQSPQTREAKRNVADAAMRNGGINATAADAVQ